MLQFVRVLKTSGMKFGLAVDANGKRWRGFNANRSEVDVMRSAALGAVGLCHFCGGRVFEGWEQFGKKRDCCASCALLPSENKVFTADGMPTTEWEALKKEFFRNENFDYQRRNESPP